MRIALSCIFTTAFILGTGVAQAGAAQPEGNLQVRTETGIPGKTLAPGTYHVQLADHLADRYLVSVEGPGQGRTLFLAIPSQKLPHKSGEVLWADPVSGTTYLRGWEFAGTRPLEFVYPKADAVAIAKANNAQVPAYDPESEGMGSHLALTAEESKVVTLWLLTPTSVGPKTPAGISAQRYTEVASLEHKPGIKKLPRTGSMLPMVWLTGLLALLGASSIRLVRAGQGAR